MNREFNLVLPNTGRIILIWTVGLAAFIAMLVAVVSHHGQLNRDVQFILMMGLLLGGGYGLFWLTKKYGGRPTLVTLTEESIAVLDQHTGQERRIGFAEIGSYRFYAFNGAEELRIRLKDGGKQKVAINTNLHGNQSMSGIVQEFELVLARYQPAMGEAIVREKTFFEKKISTVFLGIAIAMMLWFSWEIITSDKPVGGSVFMVFGGFITYTVAWYNARERRRTP